MLEDLKGWVLREPRAFFFFSLEFPLPGPNADLVILTTSCGMVVDVTAGRGSLYVLSPVLPAGSFTAQVASPLKTAPLAL